MTTRRRKPEFKVVKVDGQTGRRSTVSRTITDTVAMARKALHRANTPAGASDAFHVDVITHRRDLAALPDRQWPAAPPNPRWVDPGPQLGYWLGCPGVEQIGHGLTASSVHLAGCCDRLTQLDADEQARIGWRWPKAGA